MTWFSEEGKELDIQIILHLYSEIRNERRFWFDKSIAKFVKDADLLICEATYLDETELAREYKHLTASQAAEIARSAKAKKLILLHMSQRYERDFSKFLKVAKKKF